MPYSTIDKILIIAISTMVGIWVDIIWRKYNSNQNRGNDGKQ